MYRIVSYRIVLCTYHFDVSDIVEHEVLGFEVAVDDRTAV